MVKPHHSEWETGPPQTGRSGGVRRAVAQRRRQTRVQQLVHLDHLVRREVVPIAVDLTAPDLEGVGIARVTQGETAPAEKPLALQLAQIIEGAEFHRLLNLVLREGLAHELRDLLQPDGRLRAQILVANEQSVLQLRKISFPLVEVLDEKRQAYVTLSHEIPHGNGMPVDGMLDEMIDQLLLGRRLALRELEKPGDGDVARISHQNDDRLVPERVVRRLLVQPLADHAFVAVVSVGRRQARDGGVLPRQLVGAYGRRGWQIVAHLIKAGEHHLQPSVAAFRMTDDDQPGPLSFGQLELGQQTPPRGYS